MSEQCNGWKNRQTWLVNLWLHESGDFSYYIDRVVGLTSTIDDRESIIRHIADDMRADYADQVCDNVDRGMSLMLSDLLGHALACVDWHTIATHIVDEFSNGVAQ